MAAATPTLDVVAGALLGELSPLLPAPIEGLPVPSVIMTNVRERSAGLGRHVGTDTVADFGIVTRKGVRLDGVARFQLWAASPDDIDAAIMALNLRVLAARDDLRVHGFLKVTMKDAKPAEHLQNVGWRRSADYRVLYEFPYKDNEDAESLLARIPIGINSVLNETTEVTDRMTRWDNVTAPALVTRGPLAVTVLSALRFIPGPSPTGGVTVVRTFDGATGPPIAHATMASFLNAVSGQVPTERHASVTFASLNAFLAALNVGIGLFTLGDWDLNGVPDQYQPRSLSFAPPIRLDGAVDRFEITYESPAFDNIAVLYLRLALGVAT